MDISEFKVGDLIRAPKKGNTGNHLLRFQDGKEIDLSAFVTVKLQDDKLYAGWLSLSSYLGRILESKILIDDKRLTSSMGRLRSGRTQVFSEKDSDVKIEIFHFGNKAMYADLVDGKWYWVNGCAECNGRQRDWMTYIECEKHDRCNDCHILRKDVEGTVWGAKTGWLCPPCMGNKRSKIKREAFEKLNGAKPDTGYLDEIICPHCGSETSSADIHESQDLECDVCEGEFSLEVDYTASYSTEVKGERITS